MSFDSMRCPRIALVALLVILCWIQAAWADEHSHRYRDSEEVVVWMNTVGPYANSQETYEYTQLPFCLGSKDVEHYHETLGEALLGVELIGLGADIKFAQDRQNTTLCSTILHSKEINLFRYSVRNNYWYQMFIDDLPIWDYVGHIDDQKPTPDLYLYTHKTFQLSYNGDQIIHAEVASSNPVLLPSHLDGTLSIDFTYSVEWTETSDPYSTRFSRYLDSDFFEHKIHWFSIFNSFMMVIFLAGLVILILMRTLKHDYSRYNIEDNLLDLDRDLGDEYGWKQVHGDVFRRPAHLSILSALVGTGIQMGCLILVLLTYAIVGDLYTERATLLTVGIFLYALTALISGFFSGSYFAKYGGKNWTLTMLVTAGLWPGSVGIVSFLVNFVSISYSSSKAIPFTTMLAITAIWCFIVFPLTLLGAIMGRNWSSEPNFPCRVNPIPRPIPEKPWYAEPSFIIMASGILPFGSIFIEMYFIFSSFWGYKIYYVYGFMLGVFVILGIVTACVAVVSTYLFLNSEDHRWHWTSFFAGGSTAFYIFLYSIYYFQVKSKMYGAFQIIWYFGYTGLACFGMFVLLGTIGHLVAERFIRRIYTNVKID
ncbi:uncharacterized protein BJ171DRAFT_219912 [Polychytrium aggregatum]|uniref:uncharacterized protein n=1 Tax=Polychytrium aggregatum TaxID=110093 RepID=UPI0022FF1F3C|nr:uncharacterized protein BJ171DRAFT_219912 [Polychytrium aggregatum]KAI9199296.1 hypothetical protein BJ171DRAFT_219912 [Polychytrium aggregatum]